MIFLRVGSMTLPFSTYPKRPWPSQDSAWEQRSAYVQAAAHAVGPGGHVIVSTFGPEGPTKGSGLDVVQYNAESLHGEFGYGFRLIESTKELHETPFGTTQQFLYCFCRVSTSEIVTQ
jgi:hypothetical protein